MNIIILCTTFLLFAETLSYVDYNLDVLKLVTKKKLISRSIYVHLIRYNSLYWNSCNMQAQYYVLDHQKKFFFNFFWRHTIIPLDNRTSNINIYLVTETSVYIQYSLYSNVCQKMCRT
jgi:hypothetical protein